jgi:glutaredoxin
MRRCALLLGIVLALPLGAAHSQQLYRWVDQQGQVHVSDQRPPATARDVEKKSYGENVAPSSGVPYVLSKAMQDAPVKLYTSPNCKEPCSDAREALNKRGVPFTEVPVWNPTTNDELKRVSGGIHVPVLVVGSSLVKGFNQSEFDGALDAAGYPKAGILPERSQEAPPPPEGYLHPSQRAPKPAAAQPAEPAEAPEKLGPYAPR